MSDIGGVPGEGVAQGFSLAGYRDLSEIGRGGSSVVYRGWQADLNRWVAIKVVPLVTGEASLSQFSRERLAMGTLSGHPNIVTVYDAGLAAERTAFIVMEYLPDGTLADRLRRGPLHWSEAAVLGVRLSGALESAHRAGVLHLDVKPENVFLSRDYDAIKLGDFGIARIAGRAETLRGTISGTLLHMAPERLRDQPPTVASDVYSLGSTLFTLVLGQPPFGHAGEPPGVVMARILRRQGPPLPHAGLAQLPLSFRRIVEQALAVDPSHRQASAGEVGEQLRAAQVEAGLAPTPMLVKGVAADGPPPDPPGGAGLAGEDTAPPSPTPVGHQNVEPSSSSPTSRARKPMAVAMAGLGGLLLLVALATAASRAGPFRASPGPDDGIPPATTLAPGRPEESRLRLEDDFSNLSTGWTNAVDDAFYDHQGGYRIHLNGAYTQRAAGPRQEDLAARGLTAAGVDVRLVVEAKALSPTLVGMGLFCRQQEKDKERYQGVVFPNGRWVIARSRTGTVETLSTGEATLPGDEFQRIDFECRDDGEAARLRLKVGGTTLGEAIDPNGLKGGAMGVVAVTATASSGQVLFDNFVAASS